MIQPKKSLGQHFLTNRRVCMRILDLAGIGRADTVLEIGPGTGALTDFLLKNAGFVTALEFDRDMVKLLGEKYQDAVTSSPPRLLIHQENVLKSDWGQLLPFPGPGSARPAKIVGNLPYNIATRILEHSIRFKSLFQSFTFMTQKEVAMRIQAAPGSADYGYFTLLMDFNFQRIRGFDVPPGSFSPPPKVMSHVMQLRPLFRETGNEFLALARQAFSQRRKTLFNNLKPLFPETGRLSSILAECGIPERSRPQELSLEQFLAISDASRGMLSFKA